MEDKLKTNVNPKGFHYPNQYETMSVKTALRYLDLARDGHGLLFSPDNYYGFKALLVLKCGINIDYVFSDYFKEDEDEISSHMSTSELTMEELEKEVKKRIDETEKRLEKEATIKAARERYSKLNLFKRIKNI